MGSRPIAKTLPKALTSQVNSLTHSSKHPSLALKFAQKPIRSFLRRLEPMRCRELRAHALIDSSRAAKVGREVGDLDGAKEKESGNGLGSEEKQKIVADVRKAKKDLDRSVDGLLLIEHLNLNVMNATVGDAFYGDILGCTRDPRRPNDKTPHHNCGAMTQFHTASPDNENQIAQQGPQVWRGEVTIAYPSAHFQRIAEYLEKVKNIPPDVFFGTEFKIHSVDDGTGETEGSVFLTCPYGNRYRLRPATEIELRHLGGAFGRRPGSLPSNPIGIVELSVEVPIGSAVDIARMYKEMFGFDVSLEADSEVKIWGGPGGRSQSVRFVEVEKPPPTTGEHFAIYVSRFEETFSKCLDNNLVWVNPRFVHLDNSTDLPSAREYKQFRIRHVPKTDMDVEARQVITSDTEMDIPKSTAAFALEHEVRSVFHKSSPLKGDTNTKSSGLHPHIESSPYTLTEGVTAIDHEVEVPLDWKEESHAKTINVFAREIMLTQKLQDRSNLPILLFLQGGPGFASPRPTPVIGWVQRALEDYRVLLLDQRGTGLSTPVTFSGLGKISPVPEKQAKYLENFRQDSIVRDCEALREALGTGKISLLGQSFGGFCILTYLSTAPDSIDKAFFTVGLAPVGVEVDDVYRATYKRLQKRNRMYYNRYPMDVARMRDIVKHLQENKVLLPSGALLTPRRFQQLGMMLGSASGMESLHWLIEGAWDGSGLSYSFLKAVENAQSFDSNPIYWILHEAIYMDGEGKASEWSAHRIHEEAKQFEPLFATDPSQTPEDTPVYLTGEMVYPWMAGPDYPTLNNIKETAEILAYKKDWGNIYDIETLKDTKVKCAALISYEDMYVEKEFSEKIADVLGDNCKIWVTNEYQHSGLRDDGYNVLSTLFAMARDHKQIPS